MHETVRDVPVFGPDGSSGGRGPLTNCVSLYSSRDRHNPMFCFTTSAPAVSVSLEEAVSTVLVPKSLLYKVFVLKTA